MTAQTLHAELHQLLSLVPPYYPSWDYTRTVAFKKAVADALKQSKLKDSTKLENAMHTLRGFYRLPDFQKNSQGSATVAENADINPFKQGTAAGRAVLAAEPAAGPDFVGSPHTITSGLLGNGCQIYRINGGFPLTKHNVNALSIPWALVQPLPKTVCRHD